MSSPPEPAATEEKVRHSLLIGARVEVRNQFDGSWSAGFEVAAHTGSGYRIRRRSDGSVLPADFDDEDVRRERRNSMWWI